MGIGGISIWQLVIALAIVILLFGTKKLRGIGTDLGGAIRGFKKSINEDGGASGDPVTLDFQNTQEASAEQNSWNKR